jgi:hypothetical protein
MVRISSAACSIGIAESIVSDGEDITSPAVTPTAFRRSLASLARP